MGEAALDLFVVLCGDCAINAAGCARRVMLLVHAGRRCCCNIAVANIDTWIPTYRYHLPVKYLNVANNEAKCNGWIEKPVYLLQARYRRGP